MDPVGVVSPAELSVSDVTSKMTVSGQLMKEIRRYETPDRVLRWPLVDAKKQQWEKSYNSYKKKQSLQVALSVVEMAAAAYVGMIIIPVMRLPAVRTSLKIMNHFSSKFIRLVEDSAPRLTDQRNRMAVDGELLITLIFLPLSMFLTMLHRLFEGVASRLVSIFPPLKEAHRNFDQKGLVGQWITLLLMVYLYIPLQFLSHPTESIQYCFNIPSRVTWLIIEWNVANVVLIINEVFEWIEWTKVTFSSYIRFIQRLAMNLIDYWYYVVFRITGLEEIMASFLRMLRDYVKYSEGGMGKFIANLGRSALAESLVRTLISTNLTPVMFVKSVWNEDNHEELKTRPRISRVSRRQDSSSSGQVEVTN